MSVSKSFDYKRAGSVDEALGLLASHGDDAMLLAGGHSLIPTLKLRLAAPGTLIDLSGIEALRGIEDLGDRVRIGALTTHTDVAESDVVRSRCPLLAEAAGRIGDVQVRNVGTIGGSLAHADPGADYPPVVLVLGAHIEATGSGGVRTIAADDYFTGMFSTALEAGEILTAVIVPAVPSGTGTAYADTPVPASRYALAGVAASITMESGRCTAARVAVTGAASSPFRVPAVEQALEGSALDDASVSAAVAGMVDAGDLMSDSAGSAEYRAHLCSVMARRAIGQAAARASA